MSISIRLAEARRSLGLNQSDVAGKVGLSLRGYQANEQGVSKPSTRVLCVFVLMGINANWLITGKGEMLLEDTPAEKYQALRKAAEEALKYIDAAPKVSR